LKTIFVTGADRGLGAGITKLLLAAGHRVFAGQYMPQWTELAGMKELYPSLLSIVPLDVGDMESVLSAAKAAQKECEALDVLVNNAAIAPKNSRNTIREGQDYDGIMQAFNVNTLGYLRTTEAFLPLLDRGAGKRLCYVSSEAGSIARSNRPHMYGYCMSKAALNMGASILFNSLRPDGYTFRLYYPGWIRSYMGGTKSEQGELEPDEAAAPAVDFFLSENRGYNEDKLVMMDFEGQEWPW
jgi:NAD(P)-dependent dehydrogenase (short-subunit alcohol dehydrogenase family)